MGDTTNEADCKRVVDFTVEKFGRIDICVLAAGIAAHAPFRDIEDADIIRRIMDVNFMGSVLMTKQALPIVRANKG